MGERRELPSGVRGRAPPAKAFLAYLKPTEQSIKAQFFVKDHSIDRLRGKATGQSSPRAGEGSNSGLAGGMVLLGPRWLRAWKGALQLHNCNTPFTLEIYFELSLSPL